MLQVLVDGLVNGLNIALLALAFSVIYMPTRIFFVALAGVWTLAAYVCWACVTAGWPWLPAIAAAIASGALVGLLCEIVNHGPLERRGTSAGPHMISSLGLYVVIAQACAIVWGSESKVLRQGVDLTWSMGVVQVGSAQAIRAGGSVLLVAGFFLWLRVAALGERLRGLAENPTEMAVRGHNVTALRYLAFALGSVLASASALLLAYDVGFEPYGGLPSLLTAVVAAIMGGRNTFAGPIVGGVVLGTLQTLATWYLGAKWQDAFTFALLATFLLLAPNGLVSREQRLEGAA